MQNVTNLCLLSSVSVKKSLPFFILSCLYVSVSVSTRKLVHIRKGRDGIAPCSDSSSNFQSYECMHSAHCDHLWILIVRAHAPFPPCPCTCAVSNMRRVLKVTRESIEEMVEIVREDRSLYDPTRADHKDASMSNNIWHNIPQCAITCFMFPALFSKSPYAIHVGLYILTTRVLEVYTLTRKLCTLGEGSGSFPGCLYGCSFTDAWKHTFRKGIRVKEDIARRLPNDAIEYNYRYASILWHIFWYVYNYLESHLIVPTDL